MCKLCMLATAATRRKKTDIFILKIVINKVIIIKIQIFFSELLYFICIINTLSFVCKNLILVHTAFDNCHPFIGQAPEQLDIFF